MHRHGAEPSQQRHGLHHRVRHRLPGLQRHHAVRERDALRDAAAARLQHVHGGQVAPHAEQPGDRGGTLRPLAPGPRLPALLRLPGGRHEPVVPRARLRQPPGRAAADPRGGLSPDRGPGRQVDRVHHGPAADRSRQAVLPAPLLRRDPRAAPRARGMGRPVRRPVRPGLGRVPGGGLRPPEGAGHHRGRRRAVAPRPGRARVGLPLARGAPAVRPDDGGVRGLPESHRPPPGAPARLPARTGRARQHHRDGHLRQRRERRGRGHRDHERGAVLQQRAGDPRGEPRGHRRDRWPQALQPLPVGLDLRGQHALPALEAGDLPGRLDGPVHRLLAGRHQGTRRGALAVRAHHRHGAHRPRPPRRAAAGLDPGRDPGTHRGRQLRPRTR